MRFRSGEPAENFAVSDIFGNSVSLADYRGKKLMLSFYRYASCPLCNLRIHRLIQNHGSFQEQGLHMLAFFQSPKESILKYVGKQDAPFPIVADPERTVYKAYGVESSWAGFFKGMTLKISHLFEALRKGFKPGKMEGDKSLIPADFLIGPDQKIETAYYGNDIGDHLPIEQIEVWLRK